MRKILVVASILAATFSLRASLDGYFMLSVFSQGQLPSPAYSIYGGRVSLIYGDCQELYGLDVGVAGRIQESVYGLQINGLYSGVDADMIGAQIGLLNMVDGNVIGTQIGALNTSADFEGLQVGLLNLTDDFAGFQLGIYNSTRNFYGLQLGLIDLADNAYGCQLGVVNVAKDIYGCQLGVVNVAKNLYGCQIGLVNVVTTRDDMVWPVLNIGW